MGNQCFATTPPQKYSSYLSNIKITQLKDLWPTIKLYEIKKIYQSHAKPNIDYPGHTHLPQSTFPLIFDELSCYNQKIMKRLFQIFDLESQGFVDWESFYSGITLCYYANDDFLGLLVFMLFDHILDKYLDSTYLNLLLQSNESFLLNDLQTSISLLEPYLDSQKGIKIDKWLSVCNSIIDFSTYRKSFNILKDQKLEKQLVKHFGKWNTIYDSQNDRFVGYLLDIKWFQAWKFYIEHHFGVDIQLYQPKSQTLQTLKTIKTTKTIKLTKSMQKIKSNQMSFVPKGCKQLPSFRQGKDFDCIHSHLGERPKNITNSRLQGEYQQILKTGVTENLDYVTVSQKIWQYLKKIYEGYPQFRRTGYQIIQLYPKLVRVYIGLFKGYIDTSNALLREVSGYVAMKRLLTQSCEVKQEQISKKCIYFKTINMPRWQKIDEDDLLFNQLTSQSLIFLVCITKSQQPIFQQNHLRPPKTISQINLGDIIINKQTSQKSIYLGKNTEGKYILHTPQTSYAKDLCIIQEEVQRKYILQPILPPVNLQNTGRRRTSKSVGLPSGPGLGFFNACLIHLSAVNHVKKIISMLNSQKQQTLLDAIAWIQSILNSGNLTGNDIKSVMQQFLPEYADFQISMTGSLLEKLMKELQKNCRQKQIQNPFQKFYKVNIKKKQNCSKCHKQTKQNISNFVIRVPIPQQSFIEIMVVWVPINSKTAPQSPISYILQIPKQSTLQQLIDIFEQKANINKKPYILTEVCGEDIIKNLSFANKQTSIKKLKIRHQDKLFAYQIIEDLQEYVMSHFSRLGPIQEEHLKKDMLIDVNHSQEGWVCGKIIDIQHLPYTQMTLVRVLHRFNKNQSWEISYQMNEDTIARFPSKSHINANHYHIRIRQRCFNQASNTMQLIAFPLVQVLPTWMKWKQFSYLIYLQMRRFITSKYHFSQLPDNYKRTTEIKRNTTKNNKQNKNDKFKDYLTSPEFPYDIKLGDYDGRCALCFRFLKSVVFKGQSQVYCSGCNLVQNQPVVWQVKPADLVVYIDWRGHDRYINDPTEQYREIGTIKSCRSIKKQQNNKQINKQIKKQQKLKLQECLTQMKQSYDIQQESICCNITTNKTMSQQVQNTSDQLVIHLQRIIQQDGFKRVIQRSIDVPIKNFKYKDKTYDLVGMTSVEGDHSSARYKAFIQVQSDSWLQYDGPLVRLVPQNYILNQCALVLYYRKKT